MGTRKGRPYTLAVPHPSSFLLHPSDMLPANTILQGRYRVLRQVGRGGMGAVYEAEDQRLGLVVALKETLAETAELRAAFEREARLLARLNHPALPGVTDHFVEGAGQFLVMRYVPGQDLAEMLRTRGQPFEVAQVLAWGDALLDALAYLHAQQPPVVHRDIKPQNLKLAPTDEIVLLDFGLAKGGTSGGATQSSSAPSLAGYTPQYAPLEQIQGAGTDPRSDLYALAATLYHLLTGVQPPDALARASATLHGQPDPLIPAMQLVPPLSPALSELLSRGMALRAMDRPPTAPAIRALLRAAAQGTAPDAPTRVVSAPSPTARVAAPLPIPVAAAPLPPAPPIAAEPAPARRALPLWLTIPLLLVFCVGIAGGAWLAFGGQGADPTPTPVGGVAVVESPTPEPPSATPEPPSATAEPSATPEPSATGEPTATETATATPEPTATAEGATATSAPPATAAPTADPSTPTPTPVPGALDPDNVGEATVLHTFELPDTGRSLAFAREGALLLASSGDGAGFEVLGWESESGAAWRTLDAHEGIVWAVATSPGGEWIASGGNDRRVYFWEQERADDEEGSATAPEAVVSLVFSPTEPMVAAGTGGAGMDILLLSVPDGALLGTLDGHAAPGSVTAVAFTPDGARLLSVGTDRAVRLWDIALRAPIQSATLHSAQVSDVALTRDGTLAASAGLDNSVRLFDPTTLALARTLALDTPAFGVAFNPTGTLLAVAGAGEVTVWNVATVELLARFRDQEGPIHRVAFSPDGTLLAAVGSDASVVVWKLP